VVGVNAYRGEGDEPAVPITRVDEQLTQRRRETIRAFRGRRDAARADRARAELVTAARGTANLVPPIVAAVRAGVTLGEICADLRGVFGTYEPRAQ